MGKPTVFHDTGIAEDRKAARAANMRYYRGARPCVNGHEAPVRYTNCGQCKICSDAGFDNTAAAAQREAERTRCFSELGRTDVAPTRNEALANGQPYYLGAQCHAGHIGIRRVVNSSCYDCGVIARRAEDKDARNAYQRDYNQKNPEQAYAKTRRWVEKNPFKHAVNVKAAWRRRRARKLGAEGSHTTAEVEQLWQLQAHCCAYCGSFEAPSLDHKQPLSRGGSDDLSNLQWLCRSCNSRKKDKTDEEYRERYGIPLVTEWDATPTAIEEIIRGQ